MLKAGPIANRPSVQLNTSKKNPLVHRWQKTGQEPTKQQQPGQEQQLTGSTGVENEGGEADAGSTSQPGAEPRKDPEAEARKEKILRHIADLLPAYESAMGQLHSVVGGLGKVQGRLKTPKSLEEKTERKNRDIETITDVAGVRLTVKDMDTLQKAQSLIEQHFQLKQKEDFINEEHPTGLKYRAMHYLMDVEGKPVELQLRTERQSKWAKWSHDSLYKGEYKKSPIFRFYANALSDYFYSADRGQEAEMPDCPPQIQQLNMCLEAA